MLLNSLVTQSTYGVILCLPCATFKNFLRREKIFAQRKFYLILKIILSEIYIRDFVEFGIMAHGEQRGFLHRYFYVTEGSTLFFAWLKASKQSTPTQLTFYIRRRVYKRAHVG